MVEIMFYFPAFIFDLMNSGENKRLISIAVRAIRYVVSKWPPSSTILYAQCFTHDLLHLLLAWIDVSHKKKHFTVKYRQPYES
jgi:hypothetical protein